MCEPVSESIQFSFFRAGACLSWLSFNKMKVRDREKKFHKWHEFRDIFAFTFIFDLLKRMLVKFIYQLSQNYILLERQEKIW